MTTRGRIRIRNIVLALAGISLLTHAAAAQPARPQPVPANRQAEEIEESALPLVAAPLAFKVGAVVVKTSIGAYRVYGTAATAKAVYEYIQNRRKLVKPKINPRPGVIPKLDITVGRPAAVGPRDFPKPRNDIASNATPLVSTETATRNGFGSNPPPEEDPKRRCNYVQSPETMAYLAAPHIVTNKDMMDRLIIRENIGTAKKPAPADPVKWSADAGIPLKVMKGPLLGAYLVRLPRKYTASELSQLIFKMFLADATRRPEQKGCRYRYVDPDFPVQLYQDRPKPNDPFFADQWNLERPHQNSYSRFIVGADFIGAWQELAHWIKDQPANPADRKAFKPVTVGVPDYGFAVAVPSSQQKELDLRYGHNISNGTSNIECVENGEYLEGGCHGTKVVSILGAITNNGIGIAGALGVGLGKGWDDGIFTILPIEVGRATALVEDVRESSYMYAEGVLYAIGASSSGYPATPARVVNISWGVPVPCEGVLKDLTEVAIKEGVILVAGSGNEKGSSVLQAAAPASCPGVIAAVGHDRFGKPDPTFFEGIPGKTVSVPAAGIYRMIRYIPGGNPQVKPWDKMATSWAAPQVSAVAAMMLSIRPDLNAADVMRILTSNTAVSDSEFPLLDAAGAVRKVIDMPRRGPTPLHPIPPPPPPSPRP